MNIKVVLALIGCLLFQSAIAQKVKYKDLMVLLNARQYEQAEPHLKKYLKENDDNASAYLFMGITYHEKSQKNDVLKQTELMVANIDSAIYFYDKAYPLITEKEIKKNDENYQMYSRRDLRTGEFGIKQSDVTLDIEERTKGLKQRKENVKQLKKFYVTAEAQYTRANSYYKKLQDGYVNKKELYLLADDELIVSLEKLAATFDSCQATFKNYKASSQAVGKTGYNQVISLQEIEDFKKDGTILRDFLEDDLKLWDYTAWSKKTVRIIRDEVYPARQDALAFDSEINKMREVVKRDSAVLNTATVRNNPIFTELKKWDNDPMPLSLFNMKLTEIDYMVEEVQKSKLKGGENIQKRMNLIRKEMHTLKALDSISNSLKSRDWRKEGAFYRSYISGAYGTATVLNSLIHSVSEFAKRETVARETELNNLIGSLKWVIDASDSIPLFKDVPDASIYRPLVINDSYTAGLKLADTTVVGYFYAINAARSADLKVNFPVDSASITTRDIPLIKGISLATVEPAYFILFYSESKIDGKTPVTVARISKKTGLEWTAVTTTEFMPIDMKYTATNGELSIRTTSPDGNSKMVVLAKDGKRLQ